MYCKEKWRTAGGKDPLLGRVDGFQIEPNIGNYSSDILTKNSLAILSLNPIKAQAGSPKGLPALTAAPGACCGCFPWGKQGKALEKGGSLFAPEKM